jgi:hypothetical protein
MLGAQCNICRRRFKNIKGLRVHRARSRCTIKWNRYVATLGLQGQAIPDDPPVVDEPGSPDHPEGPPMDWDPNDAHEMSWDGRDPPRSRSASESGNGNEGDWGDDEIHAVAAEDPHMESKGPHDDLGDDRQHDMGDEGHNAQDRDKGCDDGEGIDEREGADEEHSGEDNGSDKDEEDEEDEDYEDDGDEEYEDQGGSHNESFDTANEGDSRSLDDQSCPVDEEDDDNAVEEHYPEAGRVHRTKRPHFRAVLNEKLHKSGNVYHPFANQQEWELGKWMHESGMSMSKMDEFFKLQYVSTSTPLLYTKLTRS